MRPWAHAVGSSKPSRLPTNGALTKRGKKEESGARVKNN